MPVPIVILDKAKWIWQHDEIIRFRKLWELKLSIYKIADRTNENPDDIALLAIDQAQKGKIGDGAN